MLNKKGVVSFILSLVLMFSLCNIAGAVEMGMTNKELLNELEFAKNPKGTRILEYDDTIEIDYDNRVLKDSGLHMCRYYINDKKKLIRLIKIYNNNCHDQLLPSMIKAYGKPAADYYSKKDGTNRITIEKINSMSDKDQKKIIKQKDLERRTLWENKKEYILLLSYGNGTYVMRFWKGDNYEWPGQSSDGFRVFIEN